MNASLTKPQARFLTDLMKDRAKPLEGASRHRMAHSLYCRGLISTGEPPSNYSIRLKGLQSLRDRKARQWAKHGCEAYRLQLEEIDTMIAKATSA